MKISYVFFILLFGASISYAQADSNCPKFEPGIYSAQEGIVGIDLQVLSLNLSTKENTEVPAYSLHTTTIGNIESYVFTVPLERGSLYFEQGLQGETVVTLDDVARLGALAPRYGCSNQEITILYPENKDDINNDTLSGYTLRSYELDNNIIVLNKVKYRKINASGDVTQVILPIEKPIQLIKDFNK